jgi:hypothetical protein
LSPEKSFKWNFKTASMLPISWKKTN